MTIHHIAAIDLGASSGRVMLANYHSASQRLTLREVSRFSNGLQQRNGQQCWDLEALEQHICQALCDLDGENIRLDGIGIDTWGVDFVLLDAHGERVGQAVSYRDARTQGVMAQAQREFGADEIYRRTGIQYLPFNTLYQLRALSQQQPELVERVAHLLLIPDYLHYRLTGQLNWEYTNASTTQLLNITSDGWDAELLAWAGVPVKWFGKPTPPGNRVGDWCSPSGRQVPVIAVATHDTASAVLATPLQDVDAAYLSSGTWSLMGIESPLALVNDAALAANITNEGGATGYRVLKNIMGLWLLQRITRELALDDLPTLIAQAAQQPACRWLVNPNDPRFINPVSMRQTIQDSCRERGMPVPETPAQLVRCIFDSLAMLYRQVAQQLADLHGRPLSRLHIVGGGSQNALLNQLCADATGLAVSAGPIEASTLGNVGAQLMALGAVDDIEHFRQVVVANFPLQHFTPHDNPDFAAHWPQFQSLSQSSKEFCV
ncbi:TPA: rhamnulokinase [Serratia odorifera]|nr:rhamnulokinase [Serratia odorifera]